MKQQYKRLFLFATLACALVLPLPASAIDHESDTSQQARQRALVEDARQRAEARRAEAQKIESQQKVVRERLNTAKRKVCDNRQKGINTAMGRIVATRQSQVAHITDIAEKVKAFYAKKGIELANYDALISDISAKKAAAVAAIDAIKPVASFDCGSDGPRADLQNFKDKRSAAIEAIKAYRSVVKNLITAGKAASKEATR